MTKEVREEKGKVPKSSKKVARDKSRKVLQRRVQFPYGDSVSKAGKIIKLS